MPPRTPMPFSARPKANSPSRRPWSIADRKSTRLNSSHSQISYAVFCLKKKKRSTLKKFTNCLVLATRTSIDTTDHDLEHQIERHGDVITFQAMVVYQTASKSTQHTNH